MQELQDKTLLEIAKAFKGSFIYAPGGTVNIGCVIFDGPAPKKKATQAPSEESSTPTTPRRRRKKKEEATVPPGGQPTPPLPPNDEDDEDDSGVATSASEENNNSTENVSNANEPAAPFKRNSRNRRPRNSPPAGSA